MVVNIKELKNIVSKLNLAIEKTKINPKAGWIEIETIDNKLNLRVSNYDYYLESYLNIDTIDEYIHATITADTFIPLVSKLDCNSINIYEKFNSLIIDTNESSYTFPIIKELGRVKTLDKIKFLDSNALNISVSGKDISSIAESNARGLLDSIFSKEIQQFIYVDNIGAITFTENIYINNFNNIYNTKFKFLLNCTQAKLLSVFNLYDNVSILIEQTDDYNKNIKIKLIANDIFIIFITQSIEITDKFPAIRLRALADSTVTTHAIIDKKTFDRALARLMVFDKKFDITVMNYSKLVFGEKSVKLVSIKNNNYEIIPYISYTNTFEHESIIRFADLVKQLKVINTKEIDISYGDKPAIVINSNVKQLIPEIQLVENV